MTRPPPLIVDAVALKALAHPLRIRLLDALEVEGTATASGLGAILGESSGATSYHLRQLHKAGFVDEAVGHGTSRERWWRPREGGWTLPVSDLVETAADRALADTVLQSILARSEQRMADFLSSYREWPLEWQHQAQRLEWHVDLNLEQVSALNAELLAVFEKYKSTSAGPGARRIEIGAITFPAGPPPQREQGPT